MIKLRPIAIEGFWVAVLLAFVFGIAFAQMAHGQTFIPREPDTTEYRTESGWLDEERRARGVFAQEFRQEGWKLERFPERKPDSNSLHQDGFRRPDARQPANEAPGRSPGDAVGVTGGKSKPEAQKTHAAPSPRKQPLEVYIPPKATDDHSVDANKMIAQKPAIARRPVLLTLHSVKHGCPPCLKVHKYFQKHEKLFGCPIDFNIMQDTDDAGSRGIGVVPLLELHDCCGDSYFALWEWDEARDDKGNVMLRPGIATPLTVNRWIDAVRELKVKRPEFQGKWEERVAGTVRR